MTLTETYMAEAIWSKTNFPAWISRQLGPDELKMIEDKIEFKLKNKFLELDTLETGQQETKEKGGNKDAKESEKEVCL